MGLVEQDDRIYVFRKENGEYVKYSYTVQDTYMVDADDTSIMRQDVSGKRIALITCVLQWTQNKRLVVVANQDLDVSYNYKQTQQTLDPSLQKSISTYVAVKAASDNGVTELLDLVDRMEAVVTSTNSAQAKQLAEYVLTNVAVRMSK